jgi:hypothetical protein
MSKFYIGVQKDEPITEIVWVNKNGHEDSISLEDNYIAFMDEDNNHVCIYLQDIPKLEAALAKARELGWFE